MLQVEVVTIFPQMVDTLMQYGIICRAIDAGALMVNTKDPRDYTHYISQHDRRVDDRPYGGGAGMVMMAEPLCAAIADARSVCGASGAHVIYLSPQGRKLDQDGVVELMQHKHLVLVAGRYEGIDERVIIKEVDEEWSIGDYVLSGGELAAMVMIDVLARLLPNVLGNEASAQEDSFFAGLLDYVHYTRPEKIGDHRVPSILLSGDHDKIRRWRLQQSLGRTWLRRPDLLEKLQLNDEQIGLLEAFKQQFSHEK